MSTLTEEEEQDARAGDFGAIADAILHPESRIPHPEE